MKHNLLIKMAGAILWMTSATTVIAQQKIGGTAGAANANAFLELDASGTAKKGFLNARVALTATNNASPLSAHVAGMLVYNTAAAGSGSTQVYPGLYYNNGTQWVFLNDWHITGNTGTTPSSSALGAAVNGNYWGTTDAQNLVVGVNGQNRMIFDQNYNATGGGPAGGVASGSYNFSWGTGNSIASRHSVAFGNNNNIGFDASSAWSAAIGNSNTISGISSGSAAFGSTNTITGSGYSYLFGSTNSSSTGNYNLIVGERNINNGGQSNLIFGGRNTVANSSCVVIGSTITSGAAGQFIFSPIGTVPITSTTIPNSFSSYFPGGHRFVVGNSLVLGTSAQVNIRQNNIPITGSPTAYSGTYMGIGDTTGMLQSGTGNPTTSVGSPTNGLHSTLQVAGSMAARIRVLSGSAAYTLREDDYTVVYPSGASGTITLPTAVGCTGRIYIILNETSSAVTVNTTASQARYGSTLTTGFAIANSSTVNSASGRIVVQSDGSVWHLIGN